MSSTITLVGNLTADPEIQYFDSGTAKATFSIASNRYWTDDSGEKKEQTSYYKINAWRYVAEDVARVLTKGVRVVVVGRLEQQSWNDKTTGDKRSAHVVVADSIGIGLISVESFERRSGGEAAAPSASGARTASKPAVQRRPSLPNRAAQPSMMEEEPF